MFFKCQLSKTKRHLELDSTMMENLYIISISSASLSIRITETTDRSRSKINAYRLVLSGHYKTICQQLKRRLLNAILCPFLLLGDPITTAGQRNQMIKMLAIILIPVSILVGLTGNSFGTTLNNYLYSTSIRSTLLFR